MEDLEEDIEKEYINFMFRRREFSLCSVFASFHIMNGVKPYKMIKNTYKTLYWSLHEE